MIIIHDERSEEWIIKSHNQHISSVLSDFYHGRYIKIFILFFPCRNNEKYRLKNIPDTKSVTQTMKLIVITI